MPAATLDVAGASTMLVAVGAPTVTVGSVPVRAKSLPEPLKSFDCFTAVVNTIVPADAGSRTVTETDTDWPGSRRFTEFGPGLRSLITPSTRPALQVLPLVVVGEPTDVTVTPAGTVMFAEPSDCVLVALFAIVKRRTTVLPATPLVGVTVAV